MKDQNHNDLDCNIRKLAKKYSKFLLIGDINLPTVNWKEQNSTSSLENKFINTFNDVGFEQLIHLPTHNLGNTLDLLLTTCPHLIENINIDPVPICGKSHHSTITFKFNKKLFLRKSKRRKLYNFKKANWKSLNDELSRINWKEIICYKDIHVGWNVFKSVLKTTVDKHIPTITSKSRT